MNKNTNNDLYKEQLKKIKEQHKEMLINEEKRRKEEKKAPQDSYISLQHINKVYDNHVQAVFDFNLEIKKHELIVFVGPSGCGKSTTLRMIAGLEDITTGDLYIDHKYSNELTPKERDIAMVFQNYALYPHMTVYDNLAFSLTINKFKVPIYNEDGTIKQTIDKEKIAELEKKIKALKKSNDEIDNLKLKALEDKLDYYMTTPVDAYTYKHMKKEEIDAKVKKAAEFLQLSDYLNRRPKELSGGQRQRVALGRAIVRDAKVFLMDEPLSNLDAKLRVTMRSEIIKLHKTINATTIYVTHDQTEAMTMADRIVVMKDGYIQQIDTPENIYNSPANTFVATFIGAPAMNLVDAKYSNNVLQFNNGFSIKLDNDFKDVLKKFIDKKIEDLQCKINNKDYEKPDMNVLLTLKKEKISFKNLFKKKEYKAFETPEEKLEKLNNLINNYRYNLENEHEIVFGIRPEDIYIVDEEVGNIKKSDSLELKVNVSELMGSEYLVHFDVFNKDLIAKFKSNRKINSEDSLKIYFDLNKIHLFDKISGDSII